MDRYLPGYEQQIVWGAGLNVSAGRPKVVLHTTETGPGSLQPLINHWRVNWGAGLPHFIIEGSRCVQLLPIDVGAYTLENAPGGADTNRSGPAIQVEVVSRAQNDWDDETYEMVGRWLADLKKAGHDFDIETTPRWYGANEGIILASYNSPIRMSAEEYMRFNGWCAHQHCPENCVEVSTKILKSDLTWVEAGSLEVGDELIGPEEESTPGSGVAARRFEPSTVEVNHRFTAEAYLVKTTTGDVITTANHPWLVNLPYVSRGKRVHWVETKDLTPGKHLAHFTAEPWEVENTKDAGWLAGALDADGHATSSRDAGTWVGFGQVPGKVLDKFILEMESRDFNVKTFNRPPGRSHENSKEFVDVRVMGGLWESLRVLGTLQPTRLDLRKSWDGANVGKTTSRTTILSVEAIGEREFAGLQTSSKTYIANGFLMHNSHWDCGKKDTERIKQIARNWLGTGTPPSTGDEAMTPEDKTWFEQEFKNVTEREKLIVNAAFKTNLGTTMGRDPRNNRVYEFERPGLTKRYVVSPAEFDTLATFGIPYVGDLPPALIDARVTIPELDEEALKNIATFTAEEIEARLKSVVDLHRLSAEEQQGLNPQA